MKKRFLAMTLLLAMALTLCVSAAPRYDEASSCKPYLNFSGTTANCSVSAEGSRGVSINVTMTLYHVVNGKDVKVKSWPSLAGTTSMDYTGTYTEAVSGDTYKLAVSGTVGTDKVSNSVTVRCP